MKLITFFVILLFVSLALQPFSQAEMLSTYYSVSASLAQRTIRGVSPRPQPAHNATEGFLLEYNLITANSPDCEPFLQVDSYPVRVQYRMITHPSMNGNSDVRNGSEEWIDSPYAPIPMPGENCPFSA